jgi:hypothetical protein
MSDIIAIIHRLQGLHLQRENINVEESQLLLKLEKAVRSERKSCLRQKGLGGSVGKSDVNHHKFSIGDNVVITNRIVLKDRPSNDKDYRGAVEKVTKCYVFVRNENKVLVKRAPLNVAHRNNII